MTASGQCDRECVSFKQLGERYESAARCDAPILLTALRYTPSESLGRLADRYQQALAAADGGGDDLL